MENNSKKAPILSQKYLEVMAAMSGHQTVADPTDPTSLEIREMVARKLPKTGAVSSLFSNRAIVGRLYACGESQVKPGKGTVKVLMDAHAYNHLIESANHQRPNVLFICTWPDDADGQIIFSKEAMSLICTAYWFLPDKKSKPAAANTKTVTIEIPDSQTVDGAAFGKILDEIYR